MRVFIAMLIAACGTEPQAKPESEPPVIVDYDYFADAGTLIDFDDFFDEVKRRSTLGAYEEDAGE